ncbi:MAG: hypothetical protein KF691_05960 [Phycisphaeraceae bacterium]|nr:hypothetical protein [Phycisphaeraceae bacterium]
MATKWRRAFRWVAGIAAGLALFVSLWMLKVAWRSPARYQPDAATRLVVPIMSAVEYDRVLPSHARPFVFRARVAGGEALVFGAEHTKDPECKQIAEMRRLFKEFSPTVVLVEGRPGSPIAGLGDPVRQFGEAGMALSLARSSGIPTWSWEPTRDDETSAMLNRFPKERVALFYILRPYVSDLRHGKPADPDAALESNRASRVRWRGLENSFASVREIDRVWARDFRGLPDWRDTSDEFGWPGYLSEIAEASRDVRTEQMARCVLDLCAKGERVLVVCGSSHAVRAKSAIDGGG